MISAAIRPPAAPASGRRSRRVSQFGAGDALVVNAAPLGDDPELRGGIVAIE